MLSLKGAKKEMFLDYGPFLPDHEYKPFKLCYVPTFLHQHGNIT